MERNQNRIRLFSRVAITWGFCNFVASFLFHLAREVTAYAAQRGHDLAWVLRIFHCLSSSRLRCASLSRAASRSRSRLCHPCMVFTSHAAYIILTSVARGNVRHFSVFLPNFYVFFTCSSRYLPLRCNLNNCTTRATKSKIGVLLMP